MVGSETGAQRTLFVVETPPYPPMRGGDLRNWVNVLAASRLGPVGIFAIYDNNGRGAPPPDLDPFSWAISDQFEGDFHTLKANQLWLFKEDDLPSDGLYSTGAAAELEDLISRTAPDCVVVESLWLHKYLPHAEGRGCQVVLDNYNVEAHVFAQLARVVEGTGLVAKINRDVLPPRIQRVEGRAVHRASTNWVPSSLDADRLRSIHDYEGPVMVVPNGVVPEHYVGIREGTYPPPEGIDPDEPLLLFPASFGYPPNVRGAQFLLDEVMPEVRRRHPGCRLVLAGNSPPEGMVEATRDRPDVLLTGVVEDMRPYLAASTVVLVPLFEAGGTRLKILEAFASKRLVISTAIGAEGLGAEDGEHLLLAESADDFIGEIDHVLRGRPDVQVLVDRAWDLIREAFSPDAIAAALAFPGLEPRVQGPAESDVEQ